MGTLGVRAPMGWLGPSWPVEDAVVVLRGGFVEWAGPRSDVPGSVAEPEELVEFDSMINVRPSQGNRSRGVDDPSVRGTIEEVVRRLVLP